MDYKPAQARVDVLVHMFGSDGDTRPVQASRDHVRKVTLHHAQSCHRFPLGGDEDLVRSLAHRVRLDKKAGRRKMRMEG